VAPVQCDAAPVAAVDLSALAGSTAESRISDLGGVPAAGGRNVRRSRLLRLVHAPDLGVRTAARMRAAGVRLVLDLRGFDASGAGRAAGGIDLARALARLACPGAQPAALHCADPADAGLVVTLLWEALGVPREVEVVDAGLAGRAALLGELDAHGGIDAWWAASGQPDWVLEVLRATLLERAAARTR
jgi:hypothetical protein